MGTIFENKYIVFATKMDWLYSWVGYLIVNYILLVSIVGLGSFLFNRFVKKPKLNYKNKHVIITGASTGLGKAYAKIVAKQGGKLTIISRNKERLKLAQDELSKISDYDVVATSADVIDEQQVLTAVQNGIEKHGTPDLVVACAGLSTPGLFHELDSYSFKKQMDLNYFGSLYVVKAALPSMKAAKKGEILFVSSAMGLMGFAGYAAYCPTKYAVKGLADVLRNELSLYNIGVSIYFPNSIDSPGFIQEQKTKPTATNIIEGTDDVMSPEQAADAMNVGFQQGQTYITSDAMLELIRIGSNGISPRNNLFLELLLTPITPLILTGVMFYFDYVVRTTPTADDDEKKKRK